MSAGRSKYERRTGNGIWTGSRIPKEMDIPAETCEGGLGATRPTAIDTASRYITADKPEVTAIYTSQEVTTGFSTDNTQTAPPHTDPIPPIPHIVMRCSNAKYGRYRYS